MKKIISLVICCLILLGDSVSYSIAFKQNDSEINVSQQFIDGIIVKQTVIEDKNTRSNTKTVTNQKEYFTGNTLIATIAIKGSFTYDGNTSRIISKSVSMNKTYDGWKYEQDAFTSSGYTISLKGKLKKILHSSVVIDLNLSCDKNGNISYN